ncbi:MAG: hypothetical protein UW83_C0031G0006 [Parcubacteria group bacterium GW2011_GWD1_44_9]|nr:MAG: hypothetical protein UW83_C0031G0006 [Parcubacteria group bacterium GW2011_GWD1_44_9]
MRKYFPHISAFMFTFALVFTVSGFVFPQTVQALDYTDIDPFTLLGKLLNINLFSVATEILMAPFGWLAILILQLAALITHLSGTILNYIVQFTVVDMAKNLKEATTINVAWKVIRDVANMAFIFVLLYAAIRTILGIGSDTKKLIVNIIVVAILINFSLFFTKVVIDASNILAITFYDAIAPEALRSDRSLGLSGSLMEPLRIQSLWKITTDTFKGKQLIIIGVMGTIVSLIAAFVFFAVAIMFVIRFVVLIFVMILSPLAFMGFILPQLKQYKDQWLEALLGQAFFAPIYFLLTWIVIIVSRGLFTTTTTGGDMATVFTGVVGVDGNVTSPTPESMTLLMNYIIMIVLLIASLIIAKKWADKAGHGVPGLTKWATGAAGGVAFGGLGWAGRSTLGRLGGAAAGSASLQEASDKKRSGFLWDRTKGATARLALYASRKAEGGSFDARSATIPTSAIGDLARGTVGRTRIGKALRLDDVNIPSMPVGSLAASQAGVGAGGTKGYKETTAESDKRIREREAESAGELAQAQAKRDVRQGAQALATPIQIGAMETALAKLSDKQIEVLVASNRELLESQNFANSISVKQLEALNKSDQFSESEKGAIKSNRFKVIDTALAPGGAGASSVSDNIKALSDKELEMINPGHLTNPDFVSQMRGPQFEAIAKSDKFTSSQKKTLRDVRKESLLQALDASSPSYAPTPANIRDALQKISKMGGKDFVELMRQNITLAPGTTPIPLLTHPAVLPILKPNMLKKMAVEMNDADITTLRNNLLAALPTTHKTVIWLNNPTTGGSEFA